MNYLKGLSITLLIYILHYGYGVGMVLKRVRKIILKAGNWLIIICFYDIK